MRFLFSALLLFMICAGCTCVRNPTGGFTPPQALSRAPNYCQALVTDTQVEMLNHFVVDTYNKRIAKNAGFALAKYNADGVQPVVTFANPKKPSLYYPQSSGAFHSSLCSEPTSPFFRCSDPIVFEPIAHAADSSDPLVEYARYYEPKVRAASFEYDSPSEFGPLFVALPLNPKYLYDKSGNLISGLMHVSLVKIWTAHQGSTPTSPSQALRDQFVRALKEEFTSYKRKLPAQIKLGQVQCKP